jgi:LacI family transcriptional regulator, fructose operon transcriptional repressor
MTVPTRKTTIYDIARLSGASPSTVSAALSGAWKARRIAEETVEQIRKIASEEGYSINMQARGLRKARSGMVGMIIPIHDNRFFSSLSQSFDTHARERGLCPVIASTLRSPKEEIRIVETLISYAIDSLFIAGATDPDSLSELCRAANLPHVYVDLPGKNAPSVVTDNFHGAQLLAREIIRNMPKGTGPRSKPYFIGGAANDYASAKRLDAFRNAVAESGGQISEDQIIACGYSPKSAASAIADLCDRLGGLPVGLFVNSLTAFEGVLSHFVTLPPEAFSDSVVGCFDYDPFAAFLQFPVYMVRQNSDQLIAKAYSLLENRITEASIHTVEPDLIAPRTIFKGPFGDLG